MTILRHREDLMRILPTGGRVAEIGVFGGVFSTFLLDTLKPDHLWLIDSWSWGDAENCPGRTWEINPVCKSGDEMHADVALKFCNEPSVSIFRMKSVDAAAVFDEGFFDLVYIDASHDYQDVLDDMEAWWPKVKTGGFLVGDDCIGQVEQAVTTFAKRHDGIVVQKTDVVAQYRNWWIAKP